MHHCHLLSRKALLKTTSLSSRSPRPSASLSVFASADRNSSSSSDSKVEENFFIKFLKAINPPLSSSNNKTGASSSSPTSASASSAMSNPIATDGSVSVITLGGGCFWCLEACFQQLKGVVRVESGYASGNVKNPTYEAVCGGNTGHAEVVQVSYDSSTITTDDILSVFFTLHDPTTKDRQGNDRGTQYRSIVLYHTEEQHTVVDRVMERVKAEQWWGAPLVTQVQPFDPSNYYTAEKYHQNYFATNPYQGYCRAVVAPKVAKIRSKFMKLLVA